MTENQAVIDSVISQDGTPIAFVRAGSGTPLILVHGTGADHTRWAAVLPRLAQHAAVIAMDRRGRGSSGDSPAYAVEREYEDIAAVAAAFAGPVDILGHSFGAACVMGAAPHIPNLRRLILYEPPMLQEQQSAQRAGLIQRMEQALAGGERETVVLILMQEMLRVPPAMIDRLKTTPAWAGQLAAAHTIPRELGFSEAYGKDLPALKAVTQPTLFLLGGDSLDSFKVTTETLHGLLPDSQVVLLPGQQHSAMLTAPELFAGAVIQFISQ